MASESISLAVLSISVLLAISLLLTSGISLVEKSGNSLGSQIEQQGDCEDTEFRIKSTNVNADGDFEIIIRNIGERSVFLDDVYFLIDGSVEEPDSSTIQSDFSRSLLQPREEAKFTLSNNSPNYLNIVFPNGVTESKTV